jgi:hypothetical protein
MQRALQVGDLRLFEHGSEYNGAVVSDVVVLETANGDRAVVSTGVDT